MIRAGSAVAIMFAFIAGGAVTAAYLLFGLLPVSIDQSEQASANITSNNSRLNNESWDDEEFFSGVRPQGKDTVGLNDVNASLSEAERALIDDVEASFSVGDSTVTQSSETPADAYARIVAARQARLANKANTAGLQDMWAGLSGVNGSPAFAMTILQTVTLGIAFGISFLLSQSGRKLWWMFIGFVSGVVIGWPLGVISWASMLVTSSLTIALVDGLSKSFLFAIVGAGMGVYFGRERFKNRTHSTP